MKAITCVSHFKKVSSKDSVNYGIKRDSLEWNFEGFTSDDVISLVENDDSVTLDKLTVLVNSKLEDYGRNLLLKNSDNWDFIPDNNTVNLDAVFTDLTTSISRKRTVTKESLEVCGTFYSTYAVQLLGKSPQQAAAGNKVIASKLSLIAANPDALAAIKSNIEKLIESIGEFMEDDNIPQSEKDNMDIVFNTNADVLEWLINECDNLIALSKEDLAGSL